MSKAKKALIIIDVQNDYFPGGSTPLWNPVGTLHQILRAVERAKKLDIPVVLVQHLTDPNEPFDLFIEGTFGVEIHPQLLKAAPDAPVVGKRHTDAFKETNLSEVLDGLGATDLLFCGMQTQNCVGLSAISRLAAKYNTSMLANCCTAEAQKVHYFALSGFGDIIPVDSSDKLLV